MWGRWGEGRTKRLRTGLVEFRVNEGGQEKRNEQVFWVRGKMDFWPDGFLGSSEQIHVWLLETTVL